LHDNELTYSLCVPLENGWGRLSVVESFQLIGEGIVAGLQRLGIAAALGRDDGVLVASRRAHACFQMSGMPAVLAAGRKLVGSAQRRADGAILQHGSLLLGVDFELHQAVFPAWPRDDPGRGVTSVQALLPSMPSRSAIEQALLEGWSQALGVRVAPGDLTSAERQEAQRLVLMRYATPAWTWRR
jgi:lipoate-protein ligase A